MKAASEATSEVCAHLLRFARERDAETLLDGKAELEGVDGVQTKAFAKERSVRLDVFRGHVFKV